MYEIKILRGEDAVVQKTLNQWKHSYKLKIQGFHPCEEGVVVMCLRIAKPKKA